MIRQPRIEQVKKIIVVDCDGVLLNWEDAFVTWMEHQGYERVKAVSYTHLRAHET